MKIRVGLVSLVLLSLSVSPAAHAGDKGTPGAHQVVINPTLGYASGGLGIARNSADSVQYLGCYTIRYVDGSVWAYCYAHDASGAAKVCFSTDKETVEWMRSLSSDGVLTFYWDQSGNCTKISIENSSQYMPKGP